MTNNGVGQHMHGSRGPPAVTEAILGIRSQPHHVLAGFWPDNNALHRSTMRTSERHPAKSQGICPSRQDSGFNLWICECRSWQFWVDCRQDRCR